MKRVDFSIRWVLVCMVTVVVGCKTGTSFFSGTSGSSGTTTVSSSSDFPVPSALQAGLLLGKDMEERGQLDEANDLYLTILDELGEIPAALHRLGVVATIQQDYEKANEYFRRAIAVEPNNAELIADFGYSKFMQGDMKQAERMYLQAIDLQSDLLRAHNNYAMLLAYTDRVELAEVHFKQAGITQVQTVHT